MLMTRQWGWVAGFGLILVTLGRADAGLVQLGAQHFSDGQIINDAMYASAVNGQPTPFNGFIGGDLNTNFAMSYNFAFGAQTVNSATFSIGIFDGDSAAAGNQVGAFSINGVDLTALLNTAFNGHGGTQQEYNVYTITLPTAALATIATGQAMVSLTLAGPGLAGDPGSSNVTTPFNGAGLDFSNLNINPTAVPEPSSLAMVVIAGLIGCGFARRRSA